MTIRVALHSGSTAAPIARPALFAFGALLIALLVVLAFALWPQSTPISDVRVINASTHTLRNIVVGKGHYNDLGPGQASEYRSWGPAFPHERVSFELDQTRMLQAPDDHFGEKPLGPGKFSFKVELDTSQPAGFATSVARDSM
ncbi:MAG: hypothetical protein JSR36_08550 [Proteobacteria bacterium]|nr:hypothetical protein [Pseudomonadota bacterium]